MIGLLFILMAMAAIVLPIACKAPLPTQLISCGFGIVTLVIAAIVLIITKLYIKTKANMAFVRTGMGGRKVIVDGGAIVIPVVHQITYVSLEVMKLVVTRQGKDALITKDNLRADIESEFYIKVNATQEDIINAARCLGDKAVNTENVSKLVQEKLVNALRSVAATKDLFQLQLDRVAFAEAVLAACKTDLAHNGLTLETVTISKLDQTDPKLLSDDNVFDAQGKRKIAEITQNALVQRNVIEKNAAQEIAQKNVETKKAILNLELEQEKAIAEQDQKIKIAKAEANKQAEIYRIEQEQLIKERDIEREKAIKTAGVQLDQAVAVAGVEKDKAVEVASREKLIAIANAEKLQAEAEAEKLKKLAEKEKANQEVLTVEKITDAQRQADMKLVEAKMLIEKEKLNKQMEADVSAYKQVKEAEGKKIAAVNEAEAQIKLAEADKAAKILIAEGDTAIQMVPVNVSAKQVEVNGLQVEVDRKALENKSKYEKVAVEFELRKQQIIVDGEIQKAFAAAMAQMFTNGKLQIYGDPSTALSMMNAFMGTAKVGTAIEGLLATTPQEAKDTAQKMGDIIKQAIEGLTGKKLDIDPALIESFAKMALKEKEDKKEDNN